MSAVAYCRPAGPLEVTPPPTELAVSPTPAGWSVDQVHSFYREYNRHMLHDLVAHEAMPGHALQLAHSNRYRGTTPVRAVWWSGSFVEGWAVYGEELMADHGYRSAVSPAAGAALRMQQLKMQLRMIINAIMDVRYHLGDLDEAQAMALMVGRGFQEDGEAAGKWRRVQLTADPAVDLLRRLLRGSRLATGSAAGAPRMDRAAAARHRSRLGISPGSASAGAARTVMAFLDSTPPVAFAHRGFAPDGAENSMAAFENAVRLGYRYLETDVRVTADGVALAFHDAALDRVTDRRGRVAGLPWRVVQQARIAGTEPIPLLVDVLTAWPDVCINLDVKAEHSIGPTIDAIRRTRTIDRVCVGAFSDARVGAVRDALGPQLCTALGPREAIRLRAAAMVGRLPVRQIRGACAQVPAALGRARLVDGHFLAAAHRLGLPVHVWTVNDATEMGQLLDLGVDGVMTDRADVLREVLTQRGQWLAGPPRDG